MLHAATFDFEGFLIQPALQATKPVCLAIDVYGSDRLYHCGYESRDCRDAIYRACTGGYLVGANLPFDCAVACVEWPELTEYVWAAFDAFKAWDVLQAEKLINLAQGKLEFEFDSTGKARKVEYDLGGIVVRRFGHAMQKEGGWRLKYGTLYPTPISQWPKDAVDYPIGDLSWTRRLFRDQIQAPPEYLVDVGRQTRHAWWMALMVYRGFSLSKARTLKLEEDILAEMEGLLKGDVNTPTFDFGEDGDVIDVVDAGVGLLEVGLVDKTGKREMKAVGARLKAINDAKGLPTAYTTDGDVQLTKETCKSANDPLLSAYSRYTALKVTLGKVQALKDAALAGMPIQARFEVLKDTGRTGCRGGKPKKKAHRGPNRMAYGFQLQNVKKEPGLRECFGPREGYYLGSLDYGQLESCTWAQVCLDLFGYSKMAEMLNSGVDVHSKLGAMIFGLEYEWVIENKKHDEKAKKARAGAKPFVFGKPGGMGARGMQAFAHAPPYNLDLTLEECTRYGEIWARLFTESKDYFAYVKRCVNNGRAIRQIRSHRIRGGVSFTEASNGLFQALAADTAKAAMYECVRACYTGRDSHGTRYPALHGSYLVDFIHDEGLFEFPIDRAHEAAYEAASIMNRVSEEWLPGCPSKVEPCLMLEWAKDAAPKFDANKRLIPWVKEKAA